MGILLENVCPVESGRKTRADLYIENDRIAAIGNAPVGFTADRVIDGTGKLVMPGLVNCHTHAYMSVMRNYADDVPFQVWLFKRIMPVEDALTSEEAYWGNMLSIMEMIRTGTTAFADMQMFPRMAVRACAESGMRAMITRGLVGEDRRDEGGHRRLREAFDEMEYSASIGAPVTFGLGPHAIYTCGEDFLRYVTDLAREKNLPLNIHLSETAFEYETCMKEHRMTPVAYLDSLGMLDGEILLAHCVYLAEKDYALLKRPGVHVVTNPASNMKLANGFAPVKRMLDEGIQVCLGTDGAASNNALNMFTEMRLLTMTQKGVSKDALALTADETFRIASENGARALGLHAGCIEAGALADLVFLDERSPALQPVYNPKASLVYSASGYEVTDVMIGGRMVYENGQYTTIDAERVYAEIEKIAGKYA